MEDAASYQQLAQNVFVYGSVSLALAMAKETQMLQCLGEAEAPMTSTDIAAQLHLKERYVREVLNSLTAARLVQLEAGTGGKEGQEARYWVPPTCRQVLKNFGTLILAVSSCSGRYCGMRSCFNLDGPNGIRYESNSFDAMDEVALMLLDTTTTAILQTPGLKERLERGVQALEVGCGTGRLFLRFAAMFPNSHFTLTDLTPKPMERAKQLAEKQGLTNVSFKLLDVLNLPEDLTEGFDWIACAEVIHDLPYPLKALQGISRALKPGGHFSLVDRFVSSYVEKNVGSGESAAFYAISTFKCIPESYQQPDSEALGACWGQEKAFELVRSAGLKVLGLSKPGGFGTLAVCMCQKD